MEQLNPRKEPKQARARVTYDAILEGAARVLMEEGYDKASTNRVAKVAGVSVGSLYQYFPNKDALFLALARRHMDEMIDILERCASDLLAASVGQAIHSYIEAMIAAHLLEPELHHALTAVIGRLQDSGDLVDVHCRAEVIVRAWLESHRDEVQVDDPDTAALVLVSSVEATTHAAILTRPEAMADGRLAKELCALVSRYLGVETPCTSKVPCT